MRHGLDYQVALNNPRLRIALSPGGDESGRKLTGLAVFTVNAGVDLQ
jgi:hypothetical protein